ncbi:hypothetical protein ACIQV3_36240 [Streptomyces sp. NPDC099050]|uniref:hypothetical protein n=1 Tax=Streptomyces sp. NPDC099050 TaxID=3366100 RepID=UPI00380C1DBE
MDHGHDTLPLWPRRPSLLDPHRDYLLRRWGEGEHSSTALCREITGRGYTGGHGTVRDFLAPHLAADLDAVRAGLPLTFNSGVNEGRVTGLTLIKRQIGGRARTLLLLKRGLLVAASRRTAPPAADNLSADPWLIRPEAGGVRELTHSDSTFINSRDHGYRWIDIKRFSLPADAPGDLDVIAALIARSRPMTLLVAADD